MELHTPTLALVAVSIAAILGVLLLLAWRRDESTGALVWWGIGYLCGGASFGLLTARGVIPDVLSIEIANAVLLVSYGFLYAGTRAFHGRETPATLFLVAPLIWLTAMRVPSVAADISLRVIIVSGLQCVLVSLMAYEFWRERAEALLSRWPTIVILVFQVVMLNVRMITVLTNPVFSDREFLVHRAFAVMAFGSVLYTITFAFLLLSLTKERSEQRHKIAASIDPLTSLANRRAFMSDAEAVITRRTSRSEPIALLLADLDHFKRINDVFGHPAGDRVLQLFAAALTRAIDGDDLVGRIGGEEFAILLAGKSEAAAIAVAERVRGAFAQRAEESTDARSLRRSASASRHRASARMTSPGCSAAPTRRSIRPRRRAAIASRRSAPKARRTRRHRCRSRRSRRSAGASPRVSARPRKPFVNPPGLVALAGKGRAEETSRLPSRP
ncbi:MAG TPA: GGDEF domain-containing protein [Xanthobacteraceae bacterium]|nr:GGDEF domain-containing protein [Xanthobacteraceae bacterium]